MNRRRFLSASGTAVFSGLSGFAGLTQSTVGLEFDLSRPDVDPSNVDNILLNFTKFRLLPQYLDVSKTMDVSVSVSIEGQEPVSKTAKNIGFSNGELLTDDKIEQRSGTGISTIRYPNIEASKDILAGEILVVLDHPDLSDSSYRHSFALSKTTVDSGLLGWFKLNEGSGSTSRDFADSFADSTSDQLNINHDQPWSTDSKTGQYSLDYDGSGDYATIERDYTPNDITVLAWAKPESLSSRSSDFQYTVTSLSAKTNTNDGIILGFTGDGNKKLDVSSWVEITGSSLTENQWYHIGFSHSSSENRSRLWLDGQPDKTITNSGSLSYRFGRNSHIGSWEPNFTNNDNNFVGKIDDVRYYNRELSESEVSTIYNNTK